MKQFTIYHKTAPERKAERLMVRKDGRGPTELRPLRIVRGVNKYAEGSCLIEQGHTRVICTATVEDKVPPFLKDSNSGWVTAEYGMLPRSSSTRIARPGGRGEQPARNLEIQRIIGRSLRAVVDLGALGERTITLDCDVLQADGGTRTASITGAYVALVEAGDRLRKTRALRKPMAVVEQVAAISVGVVMGYDLLDLNYEEDSQASVDMNVVMNSRGEFVELQATAEGVPFPRKRLEALLDLAGTGIAEVMKIQREALEGIA